MTDKIKERIEKEFLKIRGWKDWEEYDKIQESSELDKNLRKEIINIAIKETKKEERERIKKKIDRLLKSHHGKFIPYFEIEDLLGDLK